MTVPHIFRPARGAVHSKRLVKQRSKPNTLSCGRSTGRPMGRPREPRGRRPCGRSRKQRVVQAMKRIKIQIAGIIVVWTPALARPTPRQEPAAVPRNSIPQSTPPCCCGVRHCTEEVAWHRDDWVHCRIRHGEGRQLRHKGARVPGEEHGGRMTVPHFFRPARGAVHSKRLVKQRSTSNTLTCGRWTAWASTSALRRR